jgi:hypothetical protein
LFLKDRCAIQFSCITVIIHSTLRMSRNYDSLAVPGILTRRYFFIPIFLRRLA